MMVKETPRTVRDAVRYLSEVAGVKVVPDPESAPSGAILPPFLKEEYEFFGLRVGDRRFVLVRPEHESRLRPATVAKQLARLPLGEAESYCLLLDRVPGQLRKRLVEHGIPFVSPGVQLYWPELGAIVHARDKAVQSEPTVFRPATQAVVILGLLGRLRDEASASELGRLLGYTPMTMSRALDDLEAAGVGQVGHSGRTRTLRFGQGWRDLLEDIASRLRDPVAQRVRIHEEGVPAAMGLKSGETALAERTMLAGPQIPVLAVGKDDWKVLRDEGVEEAPFDDEGVLDLEVWHYDPVPLAEGGCVDRFSLYLSLWEVDDPRVEGALEDLFGGMG